VIHEPLGRQVELGHRMQDELRLRSKTLGAYRAQQWDTCDVNLLNLSRMNPACELYRAYAERVDQKRRNAPPTGWDGVTVFDEKQA
jgi:adenylate cyclase